MKTISLLLSYGLLLLTVGCASNRQSAEIMERTDLIQAKIFYVEHFEPDKRNFHNQISDEIAKRGYASTAGKQGEAPDEADVVVTYKDNWMWDITNYMIALKITFQEPVTNFPLAVGESYHTSLTRLSPAKMIAEVINNLFEKVESGE